MEHFEHRNHYYFNQSSCGHKKTSELDLLNLPHRRGWVRNIRCSPESLSSTVCVPILALCKRTPAAYGLWGCQVRVEDELIGGLICAAMEKSSPWWGETFQWYSCLGVTHTPVRKPVNSWFTKLTWVNSVLWSSSLPHASWKRCLHMPPQEGLYNVRPYLKTESN